MNQNDQTDSHEEHPSIIVTDHYLIDIVKALSSLTEDWKQRVQSGSVKLQFAVQVGSKLDSVRQQQLLEFSKDTNTPEKHMGKILHAFALDLPEWAIHQILRIYKQAEKTKAAVVMFNDLMDDFEAAYQQFEYTFLEGELPADDDQLEQALNEVEAQLKALYHRIPARENTGYNRFYGDSSSTSRRSSVKEEEPSFPILIGLTEEASQEEIRKQSRRLLKKLHPDRGGSAYLFGRVKQAYDAYKNQKNRGE